MSTILNKFPIKTFIIVGIIFITAISWQKSTYNQVHTMYPIEKSKNKDASEEFLKAMEYRIYIKELHPFFDYDSFIMKPLLQKMDKHFKKGKSLLPEESVEDIVWWVLFYKEIYALLSPPRDDYSLAYEKLPYQEFAKVHDEVYEMIMRYPDREVYFDIDEIKKFRFKTMAVLVEFYYKRSFNRYQGSNLMQQIKKEDKDFESVENLKRVIKKYQLTYKKHIDSSSNKKYMQYEYQSDMVSMHTELIVKYIRINNTQKLSAEICSSNGVDFILKHTDKLIDFVKNNNSKQSKFILLRFNSEKSHIPTILKLLYYRCDNLHPRTDDLLKKIEKLNENYIKKAI